MLAIGALQFAFALLTKEPFVFIPCQMEMHDKVLAGCLSEEFPQWQCEAAARIVAISLPCNMSAMIRDIDAATNAILAKKRNTVSLLHPIINWNATAAH